MSTLHKDYYYYYYNLQKSVSPKDLYALQLYTFRLARYKPLGQIIAKRVFVFIVFPLPYGGLQGTFLLIYICVPYVDGPAAGSWNDTPSS